MQKKTFLLTNDDGIDSDGLKRLAQTASEFGEVWIVAPESQRSAASHNITLRHPVDVYPYEYSVPGVHAFSCSGSPADCVRVGSISIMPTKPDVVMSGINYGYNVSSDIQYSATVGAALEGEFQGYLSIAFSEGMTDCHEVTDRYLKEIMEELIGRDYKPGFIYNVNFPHCRLEECKGIRWDCPVSRQAFFTDRYKKIQDLPGGGMSLMVDGIFAPVKEEGTDYGSILDNYITVGLVENLC